MTIVDIKFEGAYSPPANTEVDINFGELAVPGDVEDSSLVFTLSVPGVTLSAVATYASNTGVSTTANFGADWEKCNRVDNANQLSWDYADTYKNNHNSPWQDGLDVNKDSGDLYQIAKNLKIHTRDKWEIAFWARSQGKSVVFKVLDHWKLNKMSRWEITNHLARASRDSFKQLKPLAVFKVLPWILTDRLNKSFLLRYDRLAKKLFDLREIPWEQGRHPPSGMEVNGNINPPTEPYIFSTDLNFVCVCNYVDPLRVYINFGVDPCPGRGIVVPARRVYLIMNEVTLIRVSDNAEIGVFNASVGTDMSSWCWSFTATIKYSDLELVQPTTEPVEVELTINGIVWRFVVEEYSESRVFGKTGVDISGRSLTALLENPYAPVRSYTQLSTLTSRQLADNELARPGIAEGFDLDWTLVDELGWSMPLNSWSYANLTPMQAIQAIAQGSGGFVNSHRFEKQLLVKPEYPWASWEIDTATLNKSIPKSLIKLQNTKWMEKPLYNGVYVTGENTGVTAFVKREGTDGAFQAPIFMSPFITTAAVARNKGMSILSSGGMQAAINLSMPFHADIGVLVPGMVIEITNGGFDSDPAWRSFVRSTSISANRQQGGGLIVEQTIQLERHYGGL